MIKPSEVQQKATQLGVRDHQIEKDYVLSWVLWGIANHTELTRILVFKGGTVLKKVYFEDYRFSEDLDFTLAEEQCDAQFLLDWFRESFEYVQEQANIPLKISDESTNQNGINFYIDYVGPLMGMGKHKRVKIDISNSENLSFPTVKKDAILGYTDLQPYKLLCYSLEEALVEKIRCVMQRMQARDFYDIWYLLEVQGIDLMVLSEEFKTKCRQKSLNPEEFFEKLSGRLPQYKARWESSIANQIKDLPEYQKVERETLRKLRDLEI